jgi:hypothetical protein
MLLLIALSRHAPLLLQISPQSQDVNHISLDAQQRAEVVVLSKARALLPMFKPPAPKMLVEQSVNGIPQPMPAEIRLVVIIADLLILLAKVSIVIVLLEPMDFVPLLHPVPIQKLELLASKEVMDHVYG